MDEHHFLEEYDDTRYRHPSVTVDLVLLTVKDGKMRALLHRRTEHPERNKWALPGGFVGFKESLDDAARRVARDKAGIKIAYLEQLYTFGAADRDPRTRVITVAYFGLLPVQQFEKATAPELAVARIATNWSGETGGPAKAFDKSDRSLALAFDHADILGLTIKRLRGKLDYSHVGFELLPQTFHPAAAARHSRGDPRQAAQQTGVSPPHAGQEHARTDRAPRTGRNVFVLRSSIVLRKTV